MSENSTYLTGKLLLAMPAMGDQRFRKSVIYICAHDENGAMGLVVNNQMGGVEFEHLLEQLKIESNIEINLGDLNMPIMCGGPVETARGFLLHSNDFKQKETIQIDKDFSITGTVEALQKVMEGSRPKDMMFLLGYAGWGAGQLDQEIKQNSWLMMDSDPSLIFGDGSLDEKWDMAVQKLGIDPMMLSIEAGRA